MFARSPSLDPRGLLVVLFSLFATGSILTAQQPAVEVKLTGQRVEIADGKEKFSSADRARPGDLIQYDAVYQNHGKTPIQHLNATVPIPQGMTLMADTAKPAAAEATLDGKNFSPIPLMREVKNEAGVVEKQPVPLAEYRALRWALPEVAAESNATVTLRARVVNNAAK